MTSRELSKGEAAALLVILPLAWAGLLHVFGCVLWG